MVAVAVFLAILLVVASLVRDEVHQREAVMGGDEVDGERPVLTVAGEDVLRSGEAPGEVADRPAVAAPEAADVVAGAVVPFEEGRREIAELVAARTDVPGFGDEDTVGEDGIVGYGAQRRGVAGVAVRTAAENGREVEAEAVDAGMQHEMAKAVEDQAADEGVVAGDRVAGAGIVDQRAGMTFRVAEAGEVVETAKRKGGAGPVALAGMVEDQVEDDADAGLVQRRDGLAEFPHAAGAEARVQRHEADRVVAPAIGQPERRQVALVDPGGDGHQFDRIHADALQVGQHGGMGEGGNRAALMCRDVRVEDGEGLDGKLVDQAAGGQQRRLAKNLRVPAEDRLRHQAGGVNSEVRQLAVVDEGPVDLGGMRVEQQFRRVEPEAAVGIVGAVGAIAVACALADPRHRDAVDVVFAADHGMTFPLDGAFGIEDADLDHPRRRGPDRELRPTGRQGRPKCRAKGGGKGRAKGGAGRHSGSFSYAVTPSGSRTQPCLRQS